MKAFHFLGIVASFLVFNASAIAATVTPIQGLVQLNTGTGFYQLSRASQVAPGGLVMASPGGQGEIIYSDRCRVLVNPGTVEVVARESPCREAGDYTGYAIGGALAVGAGIGILAATLNHNGSVAPASP